MTATKTPTLKDLLNDANDQTLARALRALGLGDMIDPAEWDSGTISASATVQPPGGCRTIQSIRVVTSGTAASVGTYLGGDSGVTPLLPPGGASTAVGIASVSADGTTITFPNTVTRVIVRYTKLAANPSTTVMDAYLM